MMTRAEAHHQRARRRCRFENVAGVEDEPHLQGFFT